MTVLGNGVEWAHFATPRPEPPEMRGLPRPRIGYLGLLSHFLDFDVLETLRRERRGGTLVLIGPETPATSNRLREFASREGVALLGAKPYDQVPGYVQALDVGIIPFRAQDEFVQGINPNKVYQYLAAGLPVVTTPVLDLTPQPPHLWFGTDPASFVSSVEQILAAPGSADARREMARAYDWDRLAEKMVKAIEERLTA
jgi:glycosyltransferase involved in cell wall biosynthesis